MKPLQFTLAALFILFSFSTSQLFSDEILYGRYPALSPDSKTIAFTYHGDIWLVSSEGGQASRLTVHEAEDIKPQFSPDGSHILFSSNRYNNYDLFIMPVSGGPPKQITFHSEFDIGTGWCLSSDTVIFTSGREGWRDIFKVSIQGGTPIRLTGYPYEQEGHGRISSDGRYLIFNNGSGIGRWWRSDLKSSRNTDIYIYDRNVTSFTSRRLTDFSGHDIWPIYNEEKNEVYFVSCRNEWAQIYKIPFDGGEAVQLTNFTGDGVQWLNSNPQGNILVFEQGFNIWKMDPETNEAIKVPIQINTDERANIVNPTNLNTNVEWYVVSPDEKKIAAIVHGDIFVIPAKDPEDGFQITSTSARESYPTWAPDSRTLYYASDRNGDYDIYSVDVTTREEMRITDSPENELKPVTSPDGKYVVFYRGLKQLIRYDVETEKINIWVDGNFFDLGIEPTLEYDWSPDSRWLVFTMAAATYETDIYAISLDGTQYNLSRFAGWNHRPRFSNDGKLAYFTSSFSDKYQTYQIDLIHKPPEFYEASFDSLFIEDDGNKEKDNKNESKQEKDSIPEVVIDPDRIELRRKAFEISASCEYPVITPDGEKLIFIAAIMDKPEIWSLNIEKDQELKQLTKSGKSKKYLTVSSDSKEVFYLEDGVIKQVEIESGKTSSLAFSAKMEIDASRLNRQKFNETWQMLNSYYYDSDFHGADWPAIHDKYEKVVNHVRTETEFRNIIKELFGELKSSHVNIYANKKDPDEQIRTCYLGILLEYGTLEKEGYFKIARVYKESPADLAGLKTGQYILAINGQILGVHDNIYKLLAGTIDKRVTLSVAEKPDGKAQEFTLLPIASPDDYRYNEWVAERRQMVDSLSGGRLAYIHIRAMSGKELALFKERLISIAEAKDGLVIDVRNNSGGYIAVHLLGMLIRTPYFLRNFRDFPFTSENKLRSKALEKPMTLLINNYSASNSEIFAEGFRRLKLGKIIGEPTAGAVIGTASYNLIDGTRIRRPSWGAFTLDMEDTEIIPRHPDILVEILPDDFINGRDPQLTKAIEELLKELK